LTDARNGISGKSKKQDGLVALFDYGTGLEFILGKLATEICLADTGRTLYQTDLCHRIQGSLPLVDNVKV